VVLDLLRYAGERPLYLACTVSPGQLAWLRPYLRLDGLAYRVVPSSDPSVQDLAGLRRRLLEGIGYAGVADPAVLMDPTSRAMCQNYLMVLVSLAQAQLEGGETRGCLETLRFADVKAPPGRLGLPPDALASLRDRADSTARAGGTNTNAARPADTEGR
jgi:hypothetical protein